MLKYQEIYEDLEQKIKENIRNGVFFLPTEKELCTRYDASRATIRRVLHMLEEEKIVTSRQGSGHMLTGLLPDAAGNNVCLLLCAPDDYIFPSVVRSFSHTLGSQGMNVAVHSIRGSFETERRILTTLLEAPPRAVVAECFTSCPDPNLDLYRALKENGCIVIFLYGRYPGFGEFPCVRDADMDGAAMLIDFLSGYRHEHIAGIFPTDKMQGISRCAGFCEALSRRGMPPKASELFLYTHSMYGHPSLSQPAFRDMLRTFLLSIRYTCTAIVCYNDELAYAVYKEALLAGINIPQELSIVSFDHTYLQHTAPMRIVSLSHEELEPGASITHMLQTLMAGGRTDDIEIAWHPGDGTSVRMLM